MGATGEGNHAARAGGWLDQQIAKGVEAYFAVAGSRADAVVAELSASSVTAEQVQEAQQSLALVGAGELVSPAHRLLAGSEFAQASITELTNPEFFGGLCEVAGLPSGDVPRITHVLHRAIENTPEPSGLLALSKGGLTGADLFRTITRAVSPELADQVRTALARAQALVATHQAVLRAQSLPANHSPEIPEAVNGQPQPRRNLDGFTADELVEQAQQQIAQFTQDNEVNPENISVQANVGLDFKVRWTVAIQHGERTVNNVRNDTVEQALLSAKRSLDAAREVDRQAKERERFEAGIATLLREGAAPTQDEWAALLDIPHGQAFVAQKEIAGFLVTHLGVARNRVKASVGEAAGNEVLADGQEPQPVVYLANLHNILGKAHMDSELERVLDILGATMPVTVERDSQRNWVLHTTDANGQSVSRQGKTIGEAASMLSAVLTLNQGEAAQDAVEQESAEHTDVEPEVEAEAEATTVERDGAQVAEQSADEPEPLQEPHAPQHDESASEQGEPVEQPFALDMGGEGWDDQFAAARKAFEHYSRHGWELGKRYPVILRSLEGVKRFAWVSSNDTTHSAYEREVILTALAPAQPRNGQSLLTLHTITISPKGEAEFESVAITPDTGLFEKVAQWQKQAGFPAVTVELVYKPREFFSAEHHDTATVLAVDPAELAQRLTPVQPVAAPDEQAQVQKSDTPEQGGLFEFTQTPHAGERLGGGVVALPETALNSAASQAIKAARDAVLAVFEAESEQLLAGGSEVVGRGDVKLTAEVLLRDLLLGQSTFFRAHHEEMWPQTALALSEHAPVIAKANLDEAKALVKRGGQLREIEAQAIYGPGNLSGLYAVYEHYTQVEPGIIEREALDTLVVVAAMAQTAVSGREFDSESERKEALHTAYRQAEQLCEAANLRGYVVSPHGVVGNLHSGDPSDSEHSGVVLRLSHEQPEHRNWLHLDWRTGGEQGRGTASFYVRGLRRDSEELAVIRSGILGRRDANYFNSLGRWLYLENAQARGELIDSFTAEGCQSKYLENWAGNLGVNADGNQVKIDENGVRSYIESGIAVSETLRLHLDRETGISLARDEELAESPYETVVERQERLARANRLAQMAQPERSQEEDTAVAVEQPAQQPEQPEQTQQVPAKTKPPEDDSDLVLDSDAAAQALALKGGTFQKPLKELPAGIERLEWQAAGPIAVTGVENIIEARIVVKPVRLSRADMDTLGLTGIGRRDVVVWRANLLDVEGEKVVAYEVETGDAGYSRAEGVIYTDFTRLHRNLEHAATLVPELFAQGDAMLARAQNAELALVNGGPAVIELDGEEIQPELLDGSTNEPEQVEPDAEPQTGQDETRDLDAGMYTLPTAEFMQAWDRSWSTETVIGANKMRFNSDPVLGGTIDKIFGGESCFAIPSYEGLEAPKEMFATHEEAYAAMRQIVEWAHENGVDAANAIEAQKREYLQALFDETWALAQPPVQTHLNGIKALAVGGDTSNAETIPANRLLALYGQLRYEHDFKENPLLEGAQFEAQRDIATGVVVWQATAGGKLHRDSSGHVVASTGATLDEAVASLIGNHLLPEFAHASLEKNIERFGALVNKDRAAEFTDIITKARSVLSQDANRVLGSYLAGVSGYELIRSVLGDGATGVEQASETLLGMALGENWREATLESLVGHHKGVDALEDLAGIFGEFAGVAQQVGDSELAARFGQLKEDIKAAFTEQGNGDSQPLYALLDTDGQKAMVDALDDAETMFMDRLGCLPYALYSANTPSFHRGMLQWRGELELLNDFLGEQREIELDVHYERVPEQGSVVWELAMYGTDELDLVTAKGRSLRLAIDQFHENLEYARNNPSEALRQRQQEKADRMMAELEVGYPQLTSENLNELGVSAVLVDREGNEYLVMNARNHWVEVADIRDGRAVVSSDECYTVLIDPARADAYPDWPVKTLFITDRNYAREREFAKVRDAVQDRLGVEVDDPVLTADDEMRHVWTVTLPNGRTLEAYGSDALVERIGSAVSEVGADALLEPLPQPEAGQADTEPQVWTGVRRSHWVAAEERRPELYSAVETLSLFEEDGLDLSNPTLSNLFGFQGGWGVDDYAADTWSNRRIARFLGETWGDYQRYVITQRQSSYYTPMALIDQMYGAVEQAGLPSTPKILEPSCGMGNFIFGAPEHIQDSAKFVGVDMDPLACRFAKVMCPQATVLNERYEQVVLQNDFDLAIGNVPFGSMKIPDRKYGDEPFIHDYFIRKTLDQLKPGGIAVLMTSTGFMDRTATNIREDVQANSDLLNAVRLPAGVFDNVSIPVDVLVFQRRLPGVEPVRDFTALGELVGQDIDGNPIQYKVNAYFEENPDNVLGEIAVVSSQYGDKVSVEWPQGQTQGEVYQRCGEILETGMTGVVQAALAKIPTSDEGRAKAQQAASWDENSYSSGQVYEDVRVGQYLLDNGVPVEVTGFAPVFDENGVSVGLRPQLSTLNLNGPESRIFTDYIALRDAAVELRNAQLHGADESLKQAQDKAKEIYEQFVQHHGAVNSKKVSRAVQLDALFVEVSSLEVYDSTNDAVVSLADTFEKRIIRTVGEQRRIENSEDAFWASMDARGRVDMDYMVQVSGIDEDTLRDELAGRFVFVNPETGQAESRFTYLSGNVVAKLEVAERAAELNPAYLINVTELEKVRPAIAAHDDISYGLGANWIDADFVRQWVLAETNEDSASRSEFDVIYDEDSGEWSVECSSGFRRRNQLFFDSRFGSPRAHGATLLRYALQNKAPSFSVTEPDGSRVPDTVATEQAADMIKSLKAEFLAWVDSSDERKTQIETWYNERINVFAPLVITGEHQTYPGLSPDWVPMPHQADFIARGKLGYNVGCGYPVGAGKTLIQVVLAMELKRTGQATKCMIAVPNHMLGQISREAKSMYPGANIAIMSIDDLKPGRRERFMAMAANNDIDIVTITHSTLNRLRAPIRVRLMEAEERLEQLELALGEAEKKHVQNRISKMIDTQRARVNQLIEDEAAWQRGEIETEVMPFENLGVSHLLVDEFHKYKNISLNTGLDILGVRTGAGSNRATNLMEIAQYLRELHGGQSKGLITSTATLMPNSVAAEGYAALKFMAPELLKELRSERFDNYAANFGDIREGVEILLDGTAGVRTRLVGAKGGAVTAIRQIYDFLSHEQLQLPRPKLNLEVVQVPPTMLQVLFNEHLAIRATAIRDKKVEPHLDNILKIGTQGCMGAVDLRLLDDAIPADEAGNKLEMCAERVHRIWEESHEHKGTQAVFMDVGVWKNKDNQGLYGELRDLMVKRGIPKDQIRFIHEAGSSNAKKEQMFNQFNAGKIRVLIGSTEKMGVGSNIQTRIRAGHLVTVGWSPDVQEQALGRVHRQGNQFYKEVDAFLYITHNSAEAGRAQKNALKQEAVTKILTSGSVGHGVVVDESDSLEYSEILAVATGEPKISEHAQVCADYADMERQYRIWQRQQQAIRSSKLTLTSTIKYCEQQIETIEKIRNSLPKSRIYQAITVDGEANSFGRRGAVVEQEGQTSWLSMEGVEEGRGLAAVLKHRVSNAINQQLRAGGQDGVSTGISVGGVEFHVVPDPIKRGCHQFVGMFEGKVVRQLTTELGKDSLATGRAIVGRARNAWKAASWVEDVKKELDKSRRQLESLPEPQSSWSKHDEFVELGERKKELDAWMRQHDFEARYRNVPDRYLGRLAEIKAGLSQSEDQDMMLTHDSAQPQVAEMEVGMSHNSVIDLEPGIDDTMAQPKLDDPSSRPAGHGSSPTFAP